MMVACGGACDGLLVIVRSSYVSSVRCVWLHSTQGVMQMKAVAVSALLIFGGLTSVCITLLLVSIGSMYAFTMIAPLFK